MNAALSTPSPNTETAYVLLVDDDPRQLKLNRVRLQAAGYAVETATDAHDALRQARRNPPDVILSDVLMGSVDGFAFCRMARREPELASVPIVLLTSHIGNREAEVLDLAKRVGASVLLQRSDDFEAELAALRDALTTATTPKAKRADASMYEQHLRTNGEQISRLIDEARSAEARYRMLFEHANDPICLLSFDGVVIEANQRWASVLGIEPSAMVGKRIADFAAPGAADANMDSFTRSITESSGVARNVPLAHANGSIVLMDFSFSVIALNGQPIVLAIGHDVTESVRASRVIADAEERYRTLVERLPDVIWTCKVDGTLTFVTDNAHSVIGFTPQELYDETSDMRAGRVHPDDRHLIAESFGRLIQEGQTFDLEYRRKHKDGRWIWVRNRGTSSYLRGGERYIEGVISDVSERHQLEETLRQAQKMEAIGQLAGGLAHDFNNILGAILANSYFLIEALPEGDQRREDAEAIRAAVDRAAALTRQLLALGRRQMLEPKVTSLNTIALGFEKMLRRVISEDIELSVVPEPTLGCARVDVGQLEQVIMNLVVNARDAMPTGGALKIRTRNVDVDSSGVAQHAPAVPGRYVVLEVSDTGCGMSLEIKRQIFEPFFTTKGPHKGTGLGLSSCYGIVKQSSGYIAVDSEIGKGTTFRVYLPRVDERDEASVAKPPTRDTRGTETVLVIEDDGRVRAAVTRILEGQGYAVLTARDGKEALDLAASEEIDLVLSDVIMPGLSGPEVVTNVRKLWPQAKALFMSGYSDHDVFDIGDFATSKRLVNKPFSPETLAERVRDALDERPRVSTRS